MKFGLHIINRPSPDCVELVLNKEAQLAVVNDYEGLRDNPQLEVTTLATIQDVFIEYQFYTIRRRTIDNM